MSGSFRTTIKLNPSNYKISHYDKVFLLGSCFSENIHNKLIFNGFFSFSNFFGTIYNPISIANTLRLLIKDLTLEENDFILHDNKWSCFYTNTLFYNKDLCFLKKQLAEEINNKSYSFSKSSYLIITLGTSWVYKYLETGKIVSNCHKIPNNKFEKTLLKINNITETYIELINNLNKINPELKIIFTISPVRHLSDGFYENQISKSTLFLLVDNLIKKFDNIEYFPAYEVFIDDLRDYRFYAEDMIHPSKQGIEYVWNIFKERYFNTETNEICKKVEKINTAIIHKPYDTDSTEYKDFYNNLIYKKQELIALNPYLNLPEL